QNVYAFSLNNPLRFIDPNGLDAMVNRGELYEQARRGFWAINGTGREDPTDETSVGHPSLHHVVKKTTAAGEASAIVLTAGMMPLMMPFMFAMPGILATPGWLVWFQDFDARHPFMADHPYATAGLILAGTAIVVAGIYYAPALLGAASAAVPKGA